MSRLLSFLLVLTFAGCAGTPAKTDESSVAAAVQVKDFDGLPAASGLAEGRPDALVTVHSFVDPASPKFAKLHTELARLNAEHDDELRLVVRAPAKPSPAGYDALVALRAASMQGKQAETWTALMQWRKAWATGGAVALVASLTDEIGLDKEQLRTSIADGSAAALVDAEMAWAADNGLDGALAFNGRFYFEMFEATPIEAAVTESLAAAAALVDGGAPRQEVFARGAEANVGAKPFGQPFVDSELIPVGKSPTFGNRAGVVKVVAFMDFQCPYSRKSAVTMAQLVAANTQVELVFKHMPLAFHSQAREAAAISVAAAAQGRFWEMSEQLFLNQQRFTKENMDELAAELGNSLRLDVVRLLDDREAAYAVVDADVSLAEGLGVKGTPSFFVNGELISGAQPLDVFQAAVNARLAQAEELDVMPREAYAVSVLANYAKAPARPTAPPALPPYALVPVDPSDPVKGATKGFLVTIVEFADYECPFCKRTVGLMKQLADENPETLRLVYKHRPLPFHKKAHPAAAASIAAGKQGKFWQMHDALFAEQKLPPVEEMDAFTEKIAKDLGLKMKAFKRDREAADDKIAADDTLAVAVGAKGTPTFFVNGQRITGARRYEDFAKAVAEELEFARAVASETKLAGDALYTEVVKRRSAASE